MNGSSDVKGVSAKPPSAAKRRFQLIDEWRLAPRFWSIRLNVLGTTLLSAMLTWPDFVLSLWNSLPVQISGLLPPRTALAIPAVIFVAATVARLIKQERPNAGR